MEKVTETQNVTHVVSEAVWELLKAKLPETSPFKNNKQPPQLAVDEKKLRNAKSLHLHLAAPVIAVYGELVGFDVLDALYNDIVVKVTKILEDTEKPQIDPDVKFHRYLMQCCKKYYRASRNYTGPYVMLKGGSDFANNRILYKVAKKIAESHEDLPEHDTFDARILYVCARSNDTSPASTPELVNFFFGDEHITDRLMDALEYAHANWDSEARTDWLKLFGRTPPQKQTGGAHVPETPIGDDSVKETTCKKRECTPPDTFGSVLASVLHDGPKAQVRPLKKSRSSPGVKQRDECVKVLVLVVDEASWLLEKKDSKGTNYFQLLCEALRSVVSLEMYYMGFIFAVLVDSNSLISEFDQSLPRPLSYRFPKKSKPQKLFSPFVVPTSLSSLPFADNYGKIFGEGVLDKGERDPGGLAIDRTEGKQPTAEANLPSCHLLEPRESRCHE